MPAKISLCSIQMKDSHKFHFITHTQLTSSIYGLFFADHMWLSEYRLPDLPSEPESRAHHRKWVGWWLARVTEVVFFMRWEHLTQVEVTYKAHSVAVSAIPISGLSVVCALLWANGVRCLRWNVVFCLKKRKWTYSSDAASVSLHRK